MTERIRGYEGLSKYNSRRFCANPGGPRDKWEGGFELKQYIAKRVT